MISCVRLNARAGTSLGVGTLCARGSTSFLLQVEQTYAILPSIDRTVTALFEAVAYAVRQDTEQHKVIVFFPTARLAAFYSDLFRANSISVLEIHSRKSQSHRTRISEQFRTATGVVMFSSDVSARGMDYPDVTAVIQFGLPSSREQYLHRLGRTGRAGKSGKGVLILAPFEQSFLKDLKDLPVKRNLSLQSALALPPAEDMASLAYSATTRIAGDEDLLKSAQLAYAAWLGYYKGQVRGDVIVGWLRQSNVDGNSGPLDWLG